MFELIERIDCTDMKSVDKREMTCACAPRIDEPSNTGLVPLLLMGSEL